MKTEMKRKWIKALRSGKYTQTNGFLRSDNDFCCLGVLADIKGCEWIDGYRFKVPVVNGVEVKKPHAQYLLEDFADLTRNQQGRFAGMNDDGKSFKEIADAIEKTIR